MLAEYDRNLSVSKTCCRNENNNFYSGFCEEKSLLRNEFWNSHSIFSLWVTSPYTEIAFRRIAFLDEDDAIPFADPDNGYIPIQAAMVRSPHREWLPIKNGVHY